MQPYFKFRRPDVPRKNQTSKSTTSYDLEPTLLFDLDETLVSSKHIQNEERLKLISQGVSPHHFIGF